MARRSLRLAKMARHGCGMWKRVYNSNSLTCMREQLAALSPDGKTVVTGGRDAVARLWDSSSGRQLSQFRIPVTRVNEVFLRITAVAYSPKASVIAIGSNDGTIRYWETTTGRELHRFNKDGGDPEVLSFSPDGTKLLVDSWLLDSETGRELCKFDAWRRPARDPQQSWQQFGIVTLAAYGRRSAWRHHQTRLSCFFSKR